MNIYYLLIINNLLLMYCDLLLFIIIFILIILNVIIIYWVLCEIFQLFAIHHCSLSADLLIYRSTDLPVVGDRHVGITDLIPEYCNAIHHYISQLGSGQHSNHIPLLLTFSHVKIGVSGIKNFYWVQLICLSSETRQLIRIASNTW